MNNIVRKREAEKRQARENQGWRKSSTEDKRKEIRDAGNRIEDNRTKKGNGKEAGPVDASSQFRPTKILSKNSQLCEAGEAAESQAKAIEHDVNEATRIVRGFEDQLRLSTLKEAVLQDPRKFSEMRFGNKERRRLAEGKPAVFEETKKVLRRDEALNGSS
jgi:hypothetical protein